MTIIYFKSVILKPIQILLNMHMNMSKKNVFDKYLKNRIRTRTRTSARTVPRTVPRWVLATCSPHAPASRNI